VAETEVNFGDLGKFWRHNASPIYAHGKSFAVCPTKNPRQRRPLPTLGCRGVFAVCKPGFAVCFWHTANSLCPVVVLDGDASAPGATETTSADKRRHPQSSCSVLFYMIVWP